MMPGSKNMHKKYLQVSFHTLEKCTKKTKHPPSATHTRIESLSERMKISYLKN